MDLRIVLNNGEFLSQMMWLRHTGSDIYFGVSGNKEKHSYHRSGVVHSKIDGETTGRGRKVPLSELNREHHLLTLGFRTSPAFFHSENNVKQHSGKKTDSLWVIDVRSYPPNTNLQITLGLTPPFPNDSALVRLQKLAGNIPLRQLHYSTHFEPWVYAAVFEHSSESI